MIQVSHLSFSYTKRPFIQDMSFSVAQGEIFGFWAHPAPERARFRKSCWGCFRIIRALRG